MDTGIDIEDEIQIILNSNYPESFYAGRLNMEKAISKLIFKVRKENGEQKENIIRQLINILDSYINDDSIQLPKVDMIWLQELKDSLSKPSND